jgi:hypothetical protein
MGQTADRPEFVDANLAAIFLFKIDACTSLDCVKSNSVPKNVFCYKKSHLKSPEVVKINLEKVRFI